MSIPEKCTVLVVGGGPGGSYAASVLAREGIDTVLLEADKMPRYHIGESMLPSMRHYLRFIDLDDEFDAHGFNKKVGAAFKLNPQNREGFTDFLLGGPNNHSWNVVRSEGDFLMYKHAGKSGAMIFDGVKVTSVEFAQDEDKLATTNGHANHNGNVENADEHSNGVTSSDSPLPNPGKPVSATWTRKEDSTTGSIKFDYIIDASGRVGILNTKYLKNRHYNTTLKNVANWAYFKEAGIYGEGTKRAGVPIFEALRDESGWVWLIPLHNGTHSVGVVMNQDIATSKKKKCKSTQQYFGEALQQVPLIAGLLEKAKQVTEIHAASDYSYHSSAYAFPNARIVGDAGCFIDPFFSSGVHLAVTGALSAGTTIAAAIRGDVDEMTAARWHSNKVREVYARFLLLVLSAYKQIRNQGDAVLSDFNEDNFDRAFNLFKPIIQGTADATGKITQDEFSQTIDFLVLAFTPAFNPKQEYVGEGKEHEKETLTEQDLEALKGFRQHQGKHTMNIQSFTTDVIDGLVPKMERGSLTLVPAEAAE
ncbi:hypothetical protein BD289DRAFT_393427 [Coniella lustricola]|uniref:FAD-binding domain-containing protein n=1 Tax=Coniella lustricola TaxID=2025994 RepID=A0A2T3A273_9PEZI|nr:hypothetical protein BD289DRAFT_393427 [Coniella lustricola]